MKDIFKEIVQSYCKNEKIVRKVRFTEHDNIVSISIKNSSDTGLDSECFKVLNFILNILGNEKTKFIQTPFLYPNSEKVDKLNITLKSQDYKEMIKSAFGEDF